MTIGSDSTARAAPAGAQTGGAAARFVPERMHRLPGRFRLELEPGSALRGRSLAHPKDRLVHADPITAARAQELPGRNLACLVASHDTRGSS